MPSQKWFHYETVLGPETDQPQHSASHSPAQSGAPTGLGTAQAIESQHPGLEQPGLGSIQEAPVVSRSARHPLRENVG
jgi:hypothetical protein